MFCAPYQILITQTAKRFVEYGLPGDEIGYVWADHPNYDPSSKYKLPALIRLFVACSLTISIC